LKPVPVRVAIAAWRVNADCRIAGKEKTGSALLLPSCAAGFTGGSRKAGPPYILGYWWSPTSVGRPPEPVLLTYFFLAAFLAFFLVAFFAFFFVAMVHSFRLLVKENGDF
jgi:hypothetical protein